MVSIGSLSAERALKDHVVLSQVAEKRIPSRSYSCPLNK